MQVLVVTNMYPTPTAPGEGAFVAAQVESLRDRGVQVDVLHFPRLESGRGVYRGLGRKVTEAAAAQRPDLVHVAYGGLTAYVVTRAIRNRPVLVTYHGSDLLDSGGNAGPVDAVALRLGVIMSRRAARRAAGVIVVGRNLYEALPRSLDHERVWIVPNGVDLSRFRPLDRRECQRRIGWNPSRKHVLFPAARDRPEKRFDLAEATVDVLRGRGADVELHALEGVWNEEVPTWLNAADVMLLTSTHEGSPVVVKEALACNVPIVSVDVGDVRDRIGGIEGCFIAAAEPLDLAEKIGHALGRDEPINGRERITGLSLESVAERIHEIYVLLTRTSRVDATARA